MVYTNYIAMILVNENVLYSTAYQYHQFLLVRKSTMIIGQRYYTAVILRSFLGKDSILV